MNAYELTLKDYRDYHNTIDYARDKGIDLGLTKAARNIIKMGIEGYLHGIGESSRIYLIHEKNGNADTVAITYSRNDKFRFKGKIFPEGEFYFIAFDSSLKRKINSTKKYITFLLENVAIKISGNIDNLEKVSITGSQATYDYYELQELINDFKIKEIEAGFYKRLDELLKTKIKIEQKNDSVASSKLNAEIDGFLLLHKSRYNKICLDFIDKHSNSFYTPNLILKVGEGFAKNELENSYNKLSDRARNSKYGKELTDLLPSMLTAANGKLEIGSPAPNFTFKTPTGNPLSLNEVVVKGKITLLDFWASWCVPCRDEFVNVKNIYSKYHSIGFNVLGVSTDHNFQSWIKAIEKDQLPWYNVLQENKIADKLYKLYKLPTSYLLDNQGIIIAKDLRGEELWKKLNQLLN